MRRPTAFCRMVTLTLLLTALCLQVASCQPQRPADIQSGPCVRAPRIDGRFDPGEWDGATCISFNMKLTSLAGPTAPRPAELRVMNSAENLYLALQVPDAERQASLTPPKCDAVLLLFARGEEPAAGDDRKALIPGAYVDKHLTAPGKDADDARGDGQGAMVWKEGQYTAELRVPLNSGDPEDIAVKPGDRLLFNVVYADAFTADLKGTEFGGVSTGSADDTSGWGYLALASDVGTEEPAPAPEWLTKLFPHTGEPDECANRFRRLDAIEIPVRDDFGGQVTCEFIHRNVAGKTEKAQACIFLPPQVRRDPSARVPVMCNVGYELDGGGASGLLAKGWAVSTPHAHPLNPLDRGPNLDIALLHAVRALPSVDASRVMIQGGSAGGYTALMVAAESFPLICALPMVPPVNWGYNAAFFFHNRDAATAVPPGAAHPAMPVLTAVIPIAEAGIKSMGPDPQADSWLLSSPISHLDTITAPLQALWSTGDMLVPVDQVGAQFVRGLKPGAFPDSFTPSIATLMDRPQTRATLLDILPEDAYEVFLVPVPKDAPVLPFEGAAAGTPPALVMPFSKDRTWSLVVVDEGPLEPDAGHFRYAFTPVADPFLTWALDRGLQPDQLTLPKLTRLMMRLQSKEYRPFMTTFEGAQPIAAVRLDFPAAERQDVLRGLLAFAADDARAARLAECYAQLPQDLKALGDSLGATPQDTRAALSRALEEAPR